MESFGEALSGMPGRKLKRQCTPYRNLHMKIALIVLCIALGLLIAGAALALWQFNLSAMTAPDNAEISLAGKLRHFYIRRASRAPISSPPANQQASIEEGDKLFGTECAACHGLSGNKPTDAGRWMYPRAADLTLADVKQYSDRELFWIIRNGIRFSGMPAFGNVEPDEHIWNLVQYVRTLPAAN
ncbi:MAG TPA: c-type cytochrome [Candidatus Acidoferrales bacterium]|nr:c-type cytochrome [Candidatus Acidoferrales bacterium]